ncbi:MAG: hypothetical protein GY935_27860 [Gammaproteobacteria bacterium]|nr:hypothetical protein [Gammaproteobacteria bacterium]
MINGINVALRAIRNLMAFQPQADPAIQHSETEIDQLTVSRWSQRLRGEQRWDETTSLGLMSDFGLPTVAFQCAQNLEEACLAADASGYPVVLKTTMAGIAHKSDQNGVRVGIENRQQLQLTYRDLQTRLGDSVVVMPMVPAGVEVSVGMKNDPQYGPTIIVACGGVLIELLAERAFGLAPIDAEQANAMIDQIRLARLLSGLRGQAGVNREVLVDLIVQFSALALAFTDTIAEIDLNPVIVNQAGCCIVDALLIPRNLRII